MSYRRIAVTTMSARVKPASTILLTSLTCLFMLIACLDLGAADDGPVAEEADIERLADSQWSGTLGYLDYRSGQWAEIPVSMRFDGVLEGKIQFHIRYPGEAQYNVSETLTLSSNGRSLNGDSIVERRQTDTETVLVTQSRGEDDGRAADIRMHYTMGDSALVIEKTVRFEGDDAYFRRNAYELKRE